MALLCRIEGRDGLFCCMHTSRYDDGDEPFEDQWQRFLKYAESERSVIAAGDFNVPAHIKGEGYDRITESGFSDLYTLSTEKIGYDYTVKGDIDGWRSTAPFPPQRIDFILSSPSPKAKKISYSTLLDGERGEIVSDHLGILVNIEGEINDNTEIMKRREW